MTAKEETENEATQAELAVLRLMTAEEFQAFSAEAQAKIERVSKDEGLSEDERRSTIERLRDAEVVASFQRRPNAKPYVHFRERLPEWEP